MAEQIKLQQALFGYRDGHNLLATSAVLAPRVRQFLATITDSSGPESNKGFEGAFTGLPVPETDFYALFCTWPAPEMPRPGCVWSHVILIQLADLARIPELFQLRKLCSRPSLAADATRYEQPLAFNFSRIKEQGTGVLDQRRVHYIVRALYEHPKGGVVILDEESAPWENAVFKVWAQQWPRLRREFAFSTGSLGDRRLAGIPFDLQIAPISSERLWRRAGAPTILVNFLAPTSEPFDVTIPQWVDVTEEDLRNESDRRFRQFLFDYGSDIEKPRAAFGKLAAIYEQVGTANGSAWADLLRSVGESFPTLTEAIRLKRWLVSLPASLNSSEKLERAWAIVSFLLDSHQSAAYSSLDFDFANSAVSLWKEKREQTIALLSRLVQRDEKPAATSFAKGIASAVDSTSLRAIAEGHGELVPLVIRHNPELAYEVDTWKLSGHIQTQVYETLTKLSLSQADWGRIVGAMFIAATHVSVREAVAMAGEFAMSGAFRWLEHQVAKEVLPSHAWRDALASSALESLTKTEELPPRQLALCAWCAQPEELLQVLSASREDVQRLIDESFETLPYPLRVPAAFVMIALGLLERSDAGAKLIVRSFHTVDEALAAGTHSPESWRLLSPALPDLGWWRDWDRCEKLRRAVRNWLTVRGKTDEMMLEFARTPAERRVVQEISESDDSRKRSEPRIFQEDEEGEGVPKPPRSRRKKLSKS